MSEILLYHGSKEEVVYPEIRITRYTKDFSWGFYCTNSYQQAYRWADRRSADVEDPMADDTIWDYVNGFTSGQISREAFWALAKFKHPTHQISFHTVNALHCLTFERSEPIHDRKAEK